MGSNGSSGSGEFLGYKPDEVRVLLRNSASDCENALRIICNYLQTFMDNLANCWASPEAVTYSFNLTDELNKFTDDLCTEFINIANTIKYGADEWAKTSGVNEVLPSYENGVREGRSFIVSKTKDNINGLVGIVSWDAMDLAGNLKYSLTNSDSNIHLQQLKNLINSGIYFCGAEQQNNLKDSIFNITQKCSDKADKIMSEINIKVKEISEKYHTNAEKLALAFKESSGSFTGTSGTTESGSKVTFRNIKSKLNNAFNENHSSHESDYDHF